jgi:hypothetical protein
MQSHLHKRCLCGLLGGCLIWSSCPATAVLAASAPVQTEEPSSNDEMKPWWRFGGGKKHTNSTETGPETSKSPEVDYGF